MSAEVVRYLRRVLDDPNIQGVADADLLRRFVAQRDESAFELLLWRHAGMVLSVCRAILRDHHLAEDAFQAAFLALARKAGSIGRRDVVAGWLYRVAHNAALKLLHRQKRSAAAEIAAEPAAKPEPLHGEWAPIVHEELGRLPDRYRTPLVLCFLEGHSHADAARLLGWPKGTVAGRVARARDILRQRLTRRGVVLSAALFGTALTAASASAVPAPLVSTTARAALAFALGEAAGLVSSPVLRLTEGVLRAMVLSKVKSIGLVVGLAGCVVLAGSIFSGWALAQKPGSSPAGPPPIKQAEDADAVKKLKAKSVQNLKHIALAVHNYYDVNSHMPSNVVDDKGKPLLSWRVLLLPYMEQDNLYRQFKLNEPWDSEHNLKLLAKMPDVFRTGTEDDAIGTYYQGFADERALFPRGKKVLFQDITDGMSNTILVIEAGSTVPWTKPEDLPYTSNKPLPKLGGPFKDVLHTAFADGSVITINKDFDEKKMRLAVMRDDGEPQNGRDLQADPPAADPNKKPKKPAPDNLEEARMALEEAARAAQVANELRQLAEAQRDLAELSKREAQKAQAEALIQRQQSEMLRQENEKLKATLRDLAAQLNKLVPPAKADNKPGAETLKALTDELERTQTELRCLRDEVEKLKKNWDK